MSDNPIHVHEVSDEELAEQSPEYAEALARQREAQSGYREQLGAGMDTNAGSEILAERAR